MERGIERRVVVSDTGLPYFLAREKQLYDHCGRTGANTVFAGLDESERQRLAQKAADIRLEGGDWLIREGEEPRFFVVLEGLLQAVKDIVGQRRELDQVKAGEFFAEIPIHRLNERGEVSLPRCPVRCKLN